MQCPGHKDTIIGDVMHSECPKQCLEDGYPPLPGDPDWPDEDEPGDEGKYAAVTTREGATPTPDYTGRGA